MCKNTHQFQDKFTWQDKTPPNKSKYSKFLTPRFAVRLNGNHGNGGTWWKAVCEETSLCCSSHVAHAGKQCFKSSRACCSGEAQTYFRFVVIRSIIIFTLNDLTTHTSSKRRFTVYFRCKKKIVQIFFIPETYNSSDISISSVRIIKVDLND